jgi:flagellar hook assembly protein FlgD
VSNYPNPFNPQTAVRYTVPSGGAVTIAIFDARGAHVATLIDRKEHAAGSYSAQWNGNDERGAAVSSGVYFARITHPSGTRSKKMMLLK